MLALRLYKLEAADVMSKLADYYRKQTTKSLKECAIALHETPGGYTALQHVLEVLKERLGDAKLQEWIREVGIE